MRISLVVVVAAACVACEPGGPANGPPAMIAKTAGDGGQAVVGQQVTPSATVRVTDDQSRPVPGTTVTFAVASGGGSVSGPAPVTNAEGDASVGSWTLGTTAGANTLTATVENLGPVTFSATGVAGAATTMDKASTDGFESNIGAAVSPSPAVRLKDTHGNNVAGASVTFAVASGGGTATGTTQTTDVTGLATVGSWTLGSTPGTNTLSASTGSVAPLTFTMSGVDRCAQAPEYPVGSNVAGALASSDCALPTGHYTDKYTIIRNVVTAFRLDQKSTAVDSRLVLFSLPDNRLVQSGPTGFDAAMSFIVGAGSFTVGASSVNTGATGAYMLESAQTGESVENCVTHVLVNFPTTSQSIASTDCEDNQPEGTFYADIFVFFLQAGQTYCVSQTTSAFNPYIEIQTLSGSFTNAASASGSGTRTARSTINPNATEHRLIVASTLNLGQSGAYTLSVALGSCSSSIVSDGSAQSGRILVSRFSADNVALQRVRRSFRSDVSAPAPTSRLRR